ncbi:MAG: hypothetical protein NZ900_08110 [Synergistetes bacterium]|nr:hypothetical protein [Synergistota bacterium]MDW8192881.1 hypothetical protein [Synergistota bacterium]
MIYKEREKDIPPQEILTRCWNANPHGAGIAVPLKDRVYFIKGLMSFDELIKKLYELNQKLNLRDHRLLIHLRYGTSGGIKPELTHPFPIEGEELTSLEGWAKVILAHNGVIRTLGSKEKSDTYELAEWIRNLRKKKISYKDITQILKLNNGRFILLSGRWTKLIGNWIERYGYHFSNNKF